LNLALGQIVVSKAGRDAGRRFVVVRVIDDSFVEISDGDLRKIEKPKRKKIKHLTSTDEKSEILAEKLRNGVKITNAEIRKMLAGLDS